MAISIQRIDARRDDMDAGLSQLREQLSPRGNVVSPRGRQKTIEVFGRELTPLEVVETICRDVEERRLDAVLEYTAKLDGVQLDVDSVRVSGDEIEQAYAAAEQDFLNTVRRIRDNVLAFQTAILHQDVVVDRAPGIRLEQRYGPLSRVGICVPGGAAAYPSTVLMTAVPAMAAGVEQLVVVAPPTEFGANNADVLAVCRELGIREVYRIGGAQAVAAMAYGIEGLAAVEKIVGPGNLFVALAKKFVYGSVDIDSIAGPSEVVVLADETARPEFVAADLLAQAEHSPGASVLVTWSESLCDQVMDQLQHQVAQLERGSLTIESLESFGRMIIARDAAEACRITEAIAPEHLHIQTADAADLSRQIRTAGAIFVGDYTSVALGDYVAGPSHVLPTGGTAHWASGLSSNAFLRSHSVLHYDTSGLAHDAADVQLLADKEGLTAHRASVDIRLGDD